MTESEIKLLEKSLKNCANYLEFGSGESTKLAVKFLNIKRIDSIESDKNFIEKNLLIDANIVQALDSNRLRIHFIDIGPTKKWGQPVDASMKHLWPNYSTSIFNKNKDYDLVLIDGRFRISCVLNTILNINNIKILIHDFWNRPRYHIVLQFLNEIERADTLGLFKKKEYIDKLKIKSLIEKYQYLPRDETPFQRRIRRFLKQHYSIPNFSKKGTE